jgi:hypothetical protein
MRNVAVVDGGRESIESLPKSATLTSSHSPRDPKPAPAETAGLESVLAGFAVTEKTSVHVAEESRSRTPAGMMSLTGEQKVEIMHERMDEDMDDHTDDTPPR